MTALPTSPLWSDLRKRGCVALFDDEHTLRYIRCTRKWDLMQVQVSRTQVRAQHVPTVSFMVKGTEKSAFGSSKCASI